MSVLALASGCAATGAGALASRWYGLGADSLGRPRPFPTISVSLLAAVAVALAFPVVRRHEEESRLSHVATSLVGHAVHVHCQTFGQALTDLGSELGFVRFTEDGEPEPRTTIKRDPCADLRHYYGGHRDRPSLDEVVAVHVLTHESMHMRGQLDEALAECEAVQRDEDTARMLGATERQAALLARTYWLTVYPRMPDGYTTPDCHPGGSLDERLASSPWNA